LRHLDRLILEAARPGESEGEAAVVRGASGGLVLDCGHVVGVAVAVVQLTQALPMQ